MRKFQIFISFHLKGIICSVTGASVKDEVYSTYIFAFFVYIDWQEMQHLYGHQRGMQYMYVGGFCLYCLARNSSFVRSRFMKNGLYMYVCGFWLYCCTRCHTKERGNQCMYAPFVNYVQLSVRIRALTICKNRTDCQTV